MARRLLTTAYAPARRASRRELRAARADFLADPSATALLDGLPDPVLVLNPERQILACNSAALLMLGKERSEQLLGLRPGEAANCSHCRQGAGGCGTGEYCEHCGAVNAVLTCLQTRLPVSRECRLTIGQGSAASALDLLVRANLLHLAGRDYVVTALRDISAEKRRQVLERVFFHDLANTAAGIQSVAWTLSKGTPTPEQEAECRRGLWHLSQQLADEIIAQQQLLDAEEGRLELRPALVSLPELVAQVVASYRHHHLARERYLKIGATEPVTLKTDPALLRRVLGNLVKNALEAIPQGETVTLSMRAGEHEVTFLVHNPGTIPDVVQRHIFQRSFTTKEGIGRGVGTHSVRLLTERYLGGTVSFTSTPAEGTTFAVTLPRS